MAYNRKGGGGKSGSIKEIFNYYKRQLDKRLIEEQAFKEARGVGTAEGRIHTLFAGKTYEQVYNEGITRKVGNKTVRYKGIQGVVLEIESMRKRGSKSYQADAFIKNYAKAMQSKGYSSESIYKVENELRSTSIDKLTLLLDTGKVPSIQWVYAGTESEEESVERIINGLTKGTTSEEVRNLRKTAKKLAPNIKERNEILGW